jgi:acyl-CoA thioesterase
MMRSQFATESAVDARPDGSWGTTLAAPWSIGANLNGGYAVAPVLRAMGELTGAPDPLSVTTHFLRPVQSGPADVELRLVRRGRSVSVVNGSLAAGAVERFTVAAVFGDLSVPASPSPALAIPPPDLPPPESCIDRAELAQGVTLHLLERVDVRLDPRPYSALVRGEPAARQRPAIQGWIRLRDGAPPDVLTLGVFADAFPPAMTAAIDDLGWVPSIELTVHVRRRPAPGWVSARFECDDLLDGRMIESGTLWDSTGAVVARCRQLGLVLNAEAAPQAGGEAR